MSIQVLPLGGVGEIGKNMLLIRDQGKILVVDCGLMFPDERMPGVDFVIPDISYLLDKKEEVVGVILTHGHEDHIGAVPYLLPEVPAPLFGTDLTLGLLKARLQEFDLEREVSMNPISPGTPFAIEPFAIEPFRNTHSISEGCGLAIRTSEGLVIHSGDFKFDQTPVDGRPPDLPRLAAYGEEGVLLLMSDSTYADRPGFSLSERVVAKNLAEVFSRCTGRVIITTFASSIPRIQQIIAIAVQHGRKIAFVGKSLVNNVGIARDLGYLSVPPDIQIPVEAIPEYPPHQLTIMTTGSQGEPMSALSLMASSNHKWVQIVPGDTVIISATPVPGNEGSVLRNVNALYRLGAEVIFNMTSRGDVDLGARVHVAGHASQEELKLLLNLTRPRYFIPVHGEVRHLVMHARLARDVGIPEERILQILDGDLVEISQEEARIVDRVQVPLVFVDGSGVGDVGRSVLRERQVLSEEGIFLVSACVSLDAKEIVAQPEVVTRGFVYAQEAESLLNEARDLASQALRRELEKGTTDLNAIRATVKGELSRFFNERVGRKPVMILQILSSTP